MKVKDNKNGNLSEKEINEIVDRLCRPESYSGVYHRANHDFPMPSLESLGRTVDMIKSILFPGYYVHSDVRPETMRYYIGSAMDSVFTMLTEQIKRGFCFSCTEDNLDLCSDCDSRARSISRCFISTLPELRRMLGLDANAAYTGDPAAKNIGETIFCYPSLSALANYRISHELYMLEVPLIPRIITEMAHSTTGIDIHPGAAIGESFFMDHGTGTVIGETTIIGKNVRIYQGVTLGAKSFPLDSSGKPIKGIPRHPIVEDDVIIYSGATILGRVTIGRGAEIGGNVWITEDVPAGSKVMQSRFENQFHYEGSGI